MKTVTIISRYVFRELMAPFCVSLLFLTAIFLMTRIPEITNMVVNYSTGVSSIFLVILFSLPRFMEFTIPLSVMIAILLTFMKMSGDNEIIALKGGGVSIFRLLPPVLLFCLIAFVLTLWITVWGVPWGKYSLKMKGIELARSSLSFALKERKFNNSIDGVMMYVSSVDVTSKELRDVFIEDSRTEGRIVLAVAPRGILVASRDSMIYTLRLYNGRVNQVDLETRLVNAVAFDTYDINLDVSGPEHSAARLVKDLDEMDLAELILAIGSETLTSEQLNEAMMELHEKFSIPAACLALGVLSMALGLQSASSKRSSGFGLAIVFFLFYYMLLAAGWSAGEAGYYPPVVGMWLPDIVMGGLGVFLLMRIAQERPVTLPPVILKGYTALRTRRAKRRSLT